MNIKAIPLILLICVALATPMIVIADEKEEDKFDLHMGGAFRVNYSYKGWPGQENNRDKYGDFDVDVFRVDANGSYRGMHFSGQYRFYNGYSFVHHALVGYDFARLAKEGSILDKADIQVGIHQVPFGIQPYASHNWFFVLPYYVGLEDDYDMGLKAIFEMVGLSIQLGLYKNDEGSFTGNSPDSARYSYDIVKDNLGHEETNQANLRLAYVWKHGDFGSTEFGLSGEYGQIYNGAMRKYGYHTAYAGHIVGNWWRFNLQLEAAMYDHHLPGDPDDDSVFPNPKDVIEYGAYDAAYNIAAKGMLYVANIAYTQPINAGPLDSITFYNDFSMLQKDAEDFEDTMMDVAGFMISANPIYAYFDAAMGKNHPWLGGDWTTGLAQGDEDAEWRVRYNVNIGVYF